MQLRAYVAGPSGFNEAGRLFLRRRMIPAVRLAGFLVVNPWRLTDPAVIKWAQNARSGKVRLTRWLEVNHLIGKNNDLGIRRSHIVVANLDEVDSGTSCEVGIAAGTDKIIIGYRSDFRPAGDNPEAIANVQLEYYIRESGGEIYRSLSSLRRGLKEFHSKLISECA